MALKDLFEMTKADRYTADGCEELNKAREAATEDARRTYKIGEISQATGLQKTANGWVKPKSGKAAGAKSESKSSSTKIDTSAAQKKLDELTKNKASFEERNKVAEQIKAADEYNYLVENLEKRSDKPTEEMQKKLVELKTKAEGTESKPAGVTVRQGYKTKQLDETMAEHLTKNLDAYKGYDQGSMEELVLEPSGYELQGTTKSKSGKSSSVYTKGSDKVELFFDTYGELENVKTSASTESKPDGADRQDEIGGEIKGNLEAAKYYFDKAQSFSLTDPSFKTYMAKAKEYNDKAKAQADDYGFDWEEMHNRGITNAVNEFAKQNKNNKSTEAYSWFKREAGDSAPRVLTGDCKIRVRK